MGRKVTPDLDEQDIKALMEDENGAQEEVKPTPTVRAIPNRQVRQVEEEYDDTPQLPGVSVEVEKNKLKSHAYDLIAFIEIAKSKIAEAQEKLMETNKKIQDLNEASK